MWQVGIKHLFNPLIEQLDIEEMKRYAGLRQEAAFPEEIVQQAARQALLRKEVKAVWTVYAYDQQAGLLNGSYRVPSQNLYQHLAKAQQVVVMAVTVGGAIEEASDQAFKRGEYTLGLFLDAAATALVEQAADALCLMLTGELKKKGLQLTTRFSPGYGDWALEEQSAVAPLAPVEAIGVQLTAAKILQPRKSITAVSGIVTAVTGASISGCAACSQKNCPMRRIEK